MFFFGGPKDVMKKGIESIKKTSEVRVKHKYDIVIASAGGYPKDINLYQAQKAITHAALITKDHGTIILAAECCEGSGSAQFERFMSDINSYEDVIKKFNKIGFQVGPHKAFQIAREAARVDIFLISSLSCSDTARFMLKSADTVQESCDIALKKKPLNKTIAFMPSATNTIPFL